VCIGFAAAGAPGQTALRFDLRRKCVWRERSFALPVCQEHMKLLAGRSVRGKEKYFFMAVADGKANQLWPWPETFRRRGVKTRIAAHTDLGHPGSPVFHPRQITNRNLSIL
jgi:hypothetical protein